jgi:multiple sugar transport system substrate-binding protein
MKRTTSTILTRAAAALAVAVLSAAALTACGGSSAPGGDAAATGSAGDLDAALAKGGELTYWTWTPTGQAQAEAFMKKYPNVKVKVVNAGTGADHYTKLQNAVKAGAGAPDIAQVEYYALQQFAMSDALLDLNQYGLGDLKNLYTPSTWEAVNTGDGLYGLPQDSGPMVMAYNKEVFDKNGIDAPSTWDEYIAAAKKIHEADPKSYIANDAGDPGFINPLIWQAGGRPYQVDGTNVTINLQDEGTKKWAGMWNQLLQPGLLSDIPSWSDDWYKALNNGNIATLITGAWIPGILESSVEQGKGKWRIAPVPSYNGSPDTSENGGSSQAVLKQSKNPALTAAFLRWLNSSDESIGVFMEGGGFPSTVKQLNSDEFLGKAPEYFGGQKINEVMVEASEHVTSGWRYLPFQVYANSAFADTAGQSYVKRGDLNAGLQAWQNQLVTYGNQQGFAVNK